MIEKKGETNHDINTKRSVGQMSADTMTPSVWTTLSQMRLYTVLFLMTVFVNKVSV